ncbi:MAG: hypothetical protein GX964_00075 [Syntrophomonadaceae bacterium]|nr:hypothetical protein [Syntrophomonadaceae bacterium]
MLKQYVWNDISRQFHYKVWLAGIILAAAVWYQLDPGYFLMSLNLLGLLYIFLTCCLLKKDCEVLRGAMFRFGVYTTFMFLAVTLIFILFGRLAAVYACYLGYSFFSLNYLVSIWDILDQSRRVYP